MQHLTNEQLTSLLRGTGQTDAVVHVSVCAECRHELDRFQRLTCELRRFSAAHHERPEWTWIKQRVAIKERLQTHTQRQTTPRNAFAFAALLTITLLGVYFTGRFGQATRKEPGRPDGVVRRSIESDELLRIQYAAYRAVPIALQPASQISKERNQQLKKGKHDDK